MDLAIKYYDDKTLKHAIRVANLAVADLIDRNYKPDETSIIYAEALLHDILEDTNCSMEEIMRLFQQNNEMTIFWGFSIQETMRLLTHNKSVSYENYMREILDSGNFAARVIKRADLKDHFLQKETLTENLIKKYLPYIGDFL